MIQQEHRAEKIEQHKKKRISVNDGKQNNCIRDIDEGGGEREIFPRLFIVLAEEDGLRYCCGRRRAR